jgi:hypothetical protein
MRAHRTLIAFTSLAVAAGGLTLAPSASADSVQVQSYQRASESEACSAQTGETPWQAAWGADSSWHPTWEQWANDATGGWVCSRSITWAKTPAPAGSSSDDGSVSYRVGDIGPGGGLVFLISGGLRYEMAPNTWGAGESSNLTWCGDVTDVPGAVGTAVGTGAANTAAMAASVSCSNSVAAAVGLYAPAGTSVGQWFVPSKDELNAMCYYSRHVTASPDPTVSCYGESSGAGTSQNGTFESGDFGFASNSYWSSSQDTGDVSAMWYTEFYNGDQGIDAKYDFVPARPIRAF